MLPQISRLSFQNHFPYFLSKFVEIRTKGFRAKKKKQTTTTNTLDETYSDMRIDSVCQCHSVWWHFDSNIRISQTIRNDEVVEFRFFSAVVFLAKISFPGENQYLPPLNDLAFAALQYNAKYWENCIHSCIGTHIRASIYANALANIPKIVLMYLLCFESSNWMSNM